MTEAAEKLDIVGDIVAALEDGKAVRETLPSGTRIHIDRPLPFICVHQQTEGQRQAAYDITTSNASYLVSTDLAEDIDALNRIGDVMHKRFGGFLVVVVSEFGQDTFRSEDSPYLPRFEIALEIEDTKPSRAALHAVKSAIEAVSVKYRSPDVTSKIRELGCSEKLPGLDREIGLLDIQFAPIYRQPESDAIYPDLRDRVVENIFDAVLQGAAAFARTSGALKPASHRDLGRSAFIDTVRKLDLKMDEVCNSFDFLMAVTPINTSAALEEFMSGGQEKAPKLLYRPLATEIDAQKKALHAIAFENLEDPVLSGIYRDRQQELDLQLTAISLRDTPRFREASRLLYGPVEPELLRMAEEILAAPSGAGKSAKGEGGLEGHVDCHELRDAACAMIADYHADYDGFDAEVTIRDDLPAGMMVSGPCLMISRATRMSRSRVEALLSHEIGVHLMTYFTGDAQGLRIFRNGLAGYEGIQEGLAVFAEYLAGGLTHGRLRLLAARVVGCAVMLDGAEFVETYRLLTREHGFSNTAAFNLTVRLYRSGGLAKDAIYLRGLRDILDHIGAGKYLDPFWLGKFSTEQFPQISELAARGLLKTPPITPSFLKGVAPENRLEAARTGISPADLITQ